MSGKRYTDEFKIESAWLSLPVRIQSREPTFPGNKPFRFASSGSRIPYFPSANVCALPCQIGAGRLSPSILDAPDDIAPSSAAYTAPYHPLNRTMVIDRR